MTEHGRLSVRMWGSSVEVTGAKPVMMLARAVSFVLVLRALVAVGLLALATHCWFS